MKKIKIGRKNYNIKYTVRALFLFEQITKKSFKIETLLDNYVFFYCLILANNKDDVLEWDTFIDELDKNPKLFEKMSKILSDEQKKNELFEDDDDKEDDEKKS